MSKIIDGDVVKVTANAVPQKVAGLIDAVMKEEDELTLQIIGAGALNQATKAVAIANNYADSEEWELVMSPSFVTLGEGEDSVTGLRLTVAKRCKDASCGCDSLQLKQEG